MNSVSANQEELKMMLAQMGADVTSLHGIICYIRFKLDNVELAYVYNLNANNQYYLQMIKPFHEGAGVFSKPQEIVKYIKDDLKQFSNAHNSKHFDDFIEVDRRLYAAVQNVKDVFMTYNVPKQKMLQIKEKIGEVDALLEEIRSTCPQIGKL